MSVDILALGELIILSLASLLELSNLNDVAVLHEDQTFVFLSCQQQVVLHASHLLLKLNQISLGYLDEHAGRDGALSHGELASCACCLIYVFISA